MKKLGEMEKKDRAKYYLHIPDKDFSPERNRQVVLNSIKKFEATREKKYKKLVEDYQERADAVVSYLRAVDRGKSNNLLHYFDKRYLTFLRGDEIRQKLMAGLTVIGDGKVYRKKWGA